MLLLFIDRHCLPRLTWFAYTAVLLGLLAARVCVVFRTRPTRQDGIAFVLFRDSTMYCVTYVPVPYLLWAQTLSSPIVPQLTLPSPAERPHGCAHSIRAIPNWIRIRRRTSQYFELAYPLRPEGIRKTQGGEGRRGWTGA